MDTIYSRPRIRMPKISIFKYNNSENDKFKKKIFKIIVVLIIAIITMTKMLGSINVIVDKQCEAQAKSIATRISNEQATIIMNRYSYEDLFNIVKDSNRKCVYG